MSRPLLSVHFFESMSPSAELWEKWGRQAEWSENLVPLYEWDSVLFVGTPQNSDGPPNQKDWNFRAVVVGAASEQLRAYFQNLKAHAKPIKIPSLEPLANDGTPADPFGALVGSSSTHTLEESSDDFFANFSNDSSPAEPPVIENSQQSALLDLDLNIESKSPPLGSNQQPVPDQTPSKPTEFATAAAPSVRIDKSKNELLMKILEQMKTHYQKSMILKADDSNVTPWLWDSGFQTPAASSGHQISLDSASPFRIVARTLMPYHGYVVEGETQEKFFDSWNQSQIPDFLSIVPVIVDDKLVGMLLGIADKNINAKASLILLESLAANFTKALTQEPELLAS